MAVGSVLGAALRNHGAPHPLYAARPQQQRLLPIVPATADGVADRAEQNGYQAEHQDDNSDRPDDRDFGHEANYQQDDSENDHDFP
jgi:hypothetical protein